VLRFCLASATHQSSWNVACGCIQGVEVVAKGSGCSVVVDQSVNGC